MPPSVHAVVGGGRSALGPQKAGCVRCGFGFGSALPCRALPPAGRAHARLMRAPLAACSAGAALSTRSTVVFFGGSFCWCCSLNPLDCRVLGSLACGHRGSKADPLPLMGDHHSIILGYLVCWCCSLNPLDCRVLGSLACGHRGATAFGLTLVLCAPDRLLYPSISRRLYRPFLRHLLRS